MNPGARGGAPPRNLQHPGFETWRNYVVTHPDLAVGLLLQRSVPALSDAEAAAYDAPFPDRS